MQRSDDAIYARLDAHDRDLDRMQAWQNRADGAMVLATYGLGALPDPPDERDYPLSAPYASEGLTASGQDRGH